MDLSKFKTSDWLKIGGGVGMLIFGFVSWVKVSAGSVSDSGGNVFDFFFTGTIPWILIIGTAVLTVLLAMGTLKAGSLPWPLIMLAATALAVLLLLHPAALQPARRQGRDRGVRRQRRTWCRHVAVDDLGHRRRWSAHSSASRSRVAI